MAKRCSNIGLILAVAALAVALAAILAYQAFPDDHRETVVRYAGEYGVAPSLICAVIKAESNFDVTAVSAAGAKGLGQLTDATAGYVSNMLGIEYKSGDAFNAEKNIRLSARYLRYLLDKYDGDLICAAAAYNAGEGNVDKWLANGSSMKVLPFGETDRYTKKVRLYKKIYELLYDM